jgi:ankyrin repeat protein
MRNNEMDVKRAGTYDEIEPLIKLCKAGRLFEVQDWISAGKPVNVPLEAYPRRTIKSPLHIAIEGGFHSLVQLLFDGGAALEEPRYSPLLHTLEKRRLDLLELLVRHGADVRSVSMENVFGTWSSEIVEFFIERGADLETGNPLADALCSRIRPALGIFKRYKDRFPSFQEQINIALRHHCKEGNLKWVSLMLWAGADPYAQGPYGPYDDDPDDYNNALELAAFYGHHDIFKLKQIRLDPEH